jgi:hypothetical protein
MHCIVNAGSAVFITNQTLWGALFSSAAMIVISAISILIYKRKTKGQVYNK